ncbi:hypothetical protein ACFLRW_04445 [Acidobacteriota bacterium]
MKNNCDKHVFKRDFLKLLNSNYAKDRYVLVDNRVFKFNFQIPKHKKIIHTTTEKCLEFLKTKARKYICLTVGTSHFFPSIGDSQWNFYPIDMFPYPALQGYKDILLAEIHGTCYNWAEGGVKIEQYHRISVYKIDGINYTATRLSRFEDGKEIDENNLKPGEDLKKEILSVDNFSGPGQYNDALIAEGRMIGGAVKFGISKTMEKYNLSFPEAWRFLRDRGSLIKIESD